jgi:hypothetical protein
MISFIVESILTYQARYPMQKVIGVTELQLSGFARKGDFGPF